MTMLTAMPFAKSFSSLSDEDYLIMTVFCPTLFVIQVEEVRENPTGVADGMESFDVTVTGKVVEVIRGERTKKAFVHVAHEDRIVDEAEAAKVLGEQFARNFEDSKAHLASDCQVGQHYLVILYSGIVYFYHAPKNDDSWRKGILDLNEEWVEQQKE
ncbi:MAG: hypothetical protein NWT08_07020 [Akkermansiaceae bacterium]|nr:hypothetical protein [Akkermansiaceae bacterium]MDP4647337.1 hypothetical protein [Akkermansiaceae bacterium]